jgi:dihydrofolate reductase
MLWGRVTYEMMESYWPAVARGNEAAPPAVHERAIKLEAKPKYEVSSTRTDFPRTNSHHVTGDLAASVRRLKDATLRPTRASSQCVSASPQIVVSSARRPHSSTRRDANPSPHTEASPPGD